MLITRENLDAKVTDVDIDEVDNSNSVNTIADKLVTSEDEGTLTEEENKLLAVRTGRTAPKKRKAIKVISTLDAHQ